MSTNLFVCRAYLFIEKQSCMCYGSSAVNHRSIDWKTVRRRYVNSLSFPMFIILREISEVNPNTGGSEDEKHAHTAAGKSNAHTGHLSHCIQIDPGSAGRQADYQPWEEVDLHQPCRAPGGEDRQADAVNVCSKKPAYPTGGVRKSSTS